MPDFRRCESCGSTVPVAETDPPSGFVEWVSLDGHEFDRAVADIGVTILALRACDEAGEHVPARLRARIRQMESEWFNLPTSEGAARRHGLQSSLLSPLEEAALNRGRSGAVSSSMRPADWGEQPGLRRAA